MRPRPATNASSYYYCIILLLHAHTATGEVVVGSDAAQWVREVGEVGDARGAVVTEFIFSPWFILGEAVLSVLSLSLPLPLSLLLPLPLTQLLLPIALSHPLIAL